MDEVKAVVYDGSSVTSPKNWNNPHFGDPCYSLHTDSRNYVVIVLNDQGGGVMSVSDKAGTLRAQEHGHQPVVCYGISRSMLKGGMNAGGMPVEENIQPSITANGTGAVCYENLPNDNRGAVRKQPSRQLHRTGCVQRYAPGDREEQ